ncbi:MAG: hypothetical protein EZS28_031639, partial [Streblomastix strix]
MATHIILGALCMLPPRSDDTLASGPSETEQEKERVKLLGQILGFTNIPTQEKFIEELTNKHIHLVVTSTVSGLLNLLQNEKRPHKLNKEKEVLLEDIKQSPEYGQYYQALQRVFLIRTLKIVSHSYSSISISSLSSLTGLTPMKLQLFLLSQSHQFGGSKYDGKISFDVAVDYSMNLKTDEKKNVSVNVNINANVNVEKEKEKEEKKEGEENKDTEKEKEKEQTTEQPNPNPESKPLIKPKQHQNIISLPVNGTTIPLTALHSQQSLLYDLAKNIRKATRKLTEDELILIKSFTTKKPLAILKKQLQESSILTLFPTTTSSSNQLPSLIAAELPVILASLQQEKFKSAMKKLEEVRADVLRRQQAIEEKKEENERKEAKKREKEALKQAEQQQRILKEEQEKAQREAKRREAEEIKHRDGLRRIEQAKIDAASIKIQIDPDLLAGQDPDAIENYIKAKRDEINKKALDEDAEVRNLMKNRDFLVRALRERELPERVKFQKSKEQKSFENYQAVKQSRLQAHKKKWEQLFNLKQHIAPLEQYAQAKIDEITGKREEIRRKWEIDREIK